MKPYIEQYPNDPARYVRDAHGWLEDAHSALDAFVRNSEPKDDDAAINISIIEDAASDIRKLIKEYEGYFEEVTENLPEGEA